MEAYSGFASVYDEFMEDVPYDEWCDNLVKLLNDNGVTEGLIAELGCGTGSMTRRLAKRGFDMIGIDNSESMLSVAMEENEEGSLYLLQDMRQFELYGTVEAFVCVCDSLNYITEKEDLLTVFRLVNNYLEKDGIFIFDINTEYKYMNLLGTRTIAENREDASFIWENTYYEDEKINEYELTLFIKNESGSFDKSTEYHYQRAYSLDEIKEVIKLSGMEYIGAFDTQGLTPVRWDSERIYIIAREGYQENKYYGLLDQSNCGERTDKGICRND